MSYFFALCDIGFLGWCANGLVFRGVILVNVFFIVSVC